MSRKLWLVVAVVLAAPGISQAQLPKYVQITGALGTTQLKVQAANQGGSYVGLGTLTSANGAVYNMRVLSGTVQQNRYVSLQGVILAPNGTAATSFVVDGDRISGGIRLRYTGAGGAAITQTTIGSVVFFY